MLFLRQTSIIALATKEVTMAFSLSMFIICAVGILVSTLFNLRLRIGKIGFSLYWLIPLVCAIILLCFDGVDLSNVWVQFTQDSEVNPLKILVLFLSMSGLSVYLDEIGFFKWLASKVLKRAGTSQIKLFFLLYITTSILTVFTSNDVIILTFTPFICYFARNCDIDPVPFIVTEFVAANSWSMFFIIGNPTNIYLATSMGVGFGEYLKVMALPTVFAGVCSLSILYLLFRKKLSTPLTPHENIQTIDNLPSLIIGLASLAIVTILLAISSYIGIEMWIVSLVGCAFSLSAGAIATLIQKKSLKPIGKTVLRLPWQLVPFLLSMFVVVLSLSECGVTSYLASVLQNADTALTFSATSALFANLMNNIPMSVLYSQILSGVSEQNIVGALYGSIIGSNLGALLTPIGALAAIMWSSILKTQNVKFSFLDFVKNGMIVGIPSLLCAIGGLEIMLLIL